MSNQDLLKLFRPGDGGLPPYLAGRQHEQEYFWNCVQYLTSNDAPAQNMIIYGPRGNGKTALLTYLQKETLQKEKSKLDILWETPNEMETLTELSDRLIAGKPKIQGWFQSVEVSASAGVVAGKTQLGKPRQKPTIRKLLEKRSQDKPFILIIDEAHRLKPPIAESLLNASQIVRKEGNPFLLVLAGTPNLRTALGKANASFWERSEKLRLGRLSPDEARQAITIPLEKAGISFAPGVAEEVVERAHCYPFFLQLWGDCLARRLTQTGETEITIDTIQEVDATVTGKRDELYQDRFDEIKKMGLLLAAESLANTFIQSGASTLHERTLEEAIAKGMAGADEPVTDGRVLENLEHLSHLGYVWKVRGYDYEPGIPSLMTYVQGYYQGRGQRPEPTNAAG